MPSAEQILAGLEEIANRWRWLAILWHVYFGMVLVSLLFGVRPATRTMSIVLAMPLLSVGALAWLSANPFNGTFFALLGLMLIAIGVRLPPGRVQPGPLWATVAGGLMILFGWVYPHFLDAASVWSYTYAAPTGLIPCPTLSIVIGVSLVLCGLRSRAWSLVLAAAGVFYGAFGALRLGVVVDSVLLAGAVAMIAVAFSQPKRATASVVV